MRSRGARTDSCNSLLVAIPGGVALWPGPPESGATCRTQRKTPGVHNPGGLKGSTHHLG